jgi:hypothetical protein
MVKRKGTSKKIAHLASEIMLHSRSKNARRVAASDLAQSHPKKRKK